MDGRELGLSLVNTPCEDWDVETEERYRLVGNETAEVFEGIPKGGWMACCWMALGRDF